MPTLNEDAIRHTSKAAAQADLVFDLVAELEDWSQFHGPSVHAEPLGEQDGAQHYQHWWVVDDHTVRTWRARWRFDRERLRIGFEFDPAEPGGAALRGEWVFRALSESSTEVGVVLEADGYGEHDAARADGELRELLACVIEAAEQDEERKDLVVDFEDPLFVAGSIEDSYAYLYEADKWPERIPHVSRLVLEGHMTRTALTTIMTAAFAAATLVAAPSAIATTTPVGTWDATVQVPNDAHQVTFSFAPSGRACLVFGTPGGATGSGVGAWWRTGASRFAFKIPHSVIAPDGTLIGSVEVNQDAQLNRDAFTSSGVSRVFTPDGTPTGTAQATVTASRTSGETPPCR